MTPIFKTGDRVLVTLDGRTVEAVVALASPNARSLMLAFDAMLGGFAGAMPVLDEHGTGEYRELVKHRRVYLATTRATH